MTLPHSCTPTCIPTPFRQLTYEHSRQVVPCNASSASFTVIPQSTGFLATVHSCRLLREKPNSSQIALESMILYKCNKTADWLKTKSDEEKKKMFQACIKVGRNQRWMIYKQRNKELVSHREETLKQIEQCLAHKCEKEREKKILIYKQICKHGVWRTDQDIIIFKSCKDD